MHRSKQRTGVVQFLYIGLYVCSGCDGFTGICADLSLIFTPFTSENSVFEDRAAGMPTGTNGKLHAAAIRAAGIFVGKLNIIVVRLAQTTRPHHMELDPGFLHGRLIIPGTGIAVRPGIGIERRQFPVHHRSGRPVDRLDPGDRCLGRHLLLQHKADRR